MLYDELFQGTPIFKVQEDGTETVEFKPPTSKELRAARAIQVLLEKNAGLERALASATLHTDTIQDTKT